MIPDIIVKVFSCEMTKYFIDIICAVFCTKFTKNVDFGFLVRYE